MATAEPQPTAATRARSIADAAHEATLATLAVDPAGTPFASLVALATYPDGDPLLCLSDLAEHSRNLAADPRASVMAIEPAGEGDGLARGRVTLLGTCERVETAERDDARTRYLTAHTDAFYVDFGDFAFYRLRVSQVRWVGGFGAMDWVDAPAYAAGR